MSSISQQNSPNAPSRSFDAPRWRTASGEWLDLASPNGIIATACVYEDAAYPGTLFVSDKANIAQSILESTGKETRLKFAALLLVATLRYNSTRGLNSIVAGAHYRDFVDLLSTPLAKISGYLPAKLSLLTTLTPNQLLVERLSTFLWPEVAPFAFSSGPDQLILPAEKSRGFRLIRNLVWGEILSVAQRNPETMQILTEESRSAEELSKALIAALLASNADWGFSPDGCREILKFGETFGFDTIIAARGHGRVSSHEIGAALQRINRFSEQALKLGVSTQKFKQACIMGPLREPFNGPFSLNFLLPFLRLAQNKFGDHAIEGTHTNLLSLSPKLKELYPNPASAFDSWDKFRRFLTGYPCLFDPSRFVKLDSPGNHFGGKPAAVFSARCWTDRLVAAAATFPEPTVVFAFSESPTKFFYSADRHHEHAVRFGPSGKHLLRTAPKGLTDVIVRDAIFDGTLDILQRIPASSAEYLFPLELGKPPLTFIAEIHHKSDPRAHVVGDDTNCCMPFGSRLATSYALYPTTAIFSVSIVNGEGRRRTIAQSVLSLDWVIDRPVSSTIRALWANIPDVSRLLDLGANSITMGKQIQLSADSIEIAKNFCSGVQVAAITAIYSDFFARYTEKFLGSQETLCVGPNTQQFFPWRADIAPAVVKRPNTLLPVLPLLWSDRRTIENLHFTLQKSSRPCIFTAPESRLLRSNPTIGTNPLSIWDCWDGALDQQLRSGHSNLDHLVVELIRTEICEAKGITPTPWIGTRDTSGSGVLRRVERPKLTE